MLLHFGTVRAAENIAAGFDEANRLYEEGRFADAAEAYQKLVAGGKISEAIYFNLGNAQFKSGQAGRAIAAYRQAERLAPRDPDVQANLQFARKSVTGGVDLTPHRWQDWLRRLTLDEWSWLAAGCGWLFGLLLAAMQWQSKWKPALRTPSILAGLLFGVMVIGMGLAMWEQASSRDAVIIVREGMARQGPLEEARTAFPLVDGLEVAILDTKDDWLEVKDSTQRVGWVKRDQLAVLLK